MSDRIAFMGAGNMAEALVRGLRGDGVAPDSITVTDTRPEQLEKFRKEFGVKGTSSNRDAAATADVVVLAVKPQVMDDVLRELRGHVPARALVISIAAGVRCAKIEAALGGESRVVRVMPNTPALVKAGVSAVFGGRHVSANDVARAIRLMKSVGEVVQVPEEDLMDAVTAVSGSGPAYVFYLMEAMLSAARDLGLDETVARQLVVGTISGSAKLAALDDTPPETLRARVTSKGGTTAAAVDVLDRNQVRKVMEQAIAAAAARSRELSR